MVPLNTMKLLSVFIYGFSKAIKMFTLPHERNETTKWLRQWLLKTPNWNSAHFCMFIHCMCVCWHSVLQIAKMLCIPTTTTIICDMTTINVLVFRTRYEHFCQRLHMFVHLPVCYLVHSLVQPFRPSLSHWKSISIHVSKRVHTFN